MGDFEYGGDAGLLKDITEDRQRAQRFKQQFRSSHDSSETWRLRAIESYEFVSGNQWPAEDLERLHRERRPALTINKVLAPVLFLLGSQRQQRTEPKLLPFESGDIRHAELMQGLLKWVGGRARESAVDSHVFQDKIITGLGYWKIGLDYYEDPEGELVWERLHPLSVFPDPNWLDLGWRNAAWVHHAVWMGLEAAMARWPKCRDKIRRMFGDWVGGENQLSGEASLHVTAEMTGDSLADRRLFWDPDTQRARILEVWYCKHVNVTVAVDQEDGNVLSTDPDEVELLRDNMGRMGDLKDRVSFIRRSVKRVWVAHVFNDVLLDDKPSPYTEQKFPIFPARGFYFWRHPFGLVEPMKDPQREKNRRRSTIIDMINRMPHGGFLNSRDRGAKTEDIEKFATGQGPVINYGDVAPTQLKSPDLPQTLVYLEKQSDSEVNSVVNINNELLGNTTQRTVSGRAISARQKSGMVVQEPLLDTFQQEKEEATRFMVAMIKQYVTLPKALRILGTIAQRQPQNPLAQMVESTEPTELIETLTDAFDADYDVVISHVSVEPGIQVQRMQILAELAEQFQGQIPPEVLVDAAKNAALISEADAEKIIAYVQQQQQLQQAAAASSIASGSPPPAEAISAG